MKKEEDIFKHYRKKRRIIVGISIFLLIILIIFRNSSLLLRVSSAIGLLFVFYITDHFFNLKFEPRHYVAIIIIAVTGLLLSPLYFLYPQYDKVLHFILPMIFGSIVFHMVSRLKIDLKWQLTFTFFVVLGVIGLHEIGEYFLDVLFDLKLQGVFLRGDIGGIEKFDEVVSRIDDTMIDMGLGVLGALFYSLFVYLFHEVEIKKHSH